MTSAVGARAVRTGLLISGIRSRQALRFCLGSLLFVLAIAPAAAQTTGRSAPDSLPPSLDRCTHVPGGGRFALPVVARLPSDEIPKHFDLDGDGTVELYAQFATHLFALRSPHEAAQFERVFTLIPRDGTLRSLQPVD